MPDGLNDVGETITEVLAEPLGEIVKHVGRAIAETQQALDRNSIAIEAELADKREELGYDLHATWYHLPETDIEIKMSLSMHWEEEKKAGKTVAWKPILYAAPLNASYKNLFNYDATGTSVLKAKIVSIPPASMIEEG
jgi:hypothetical protein